MISNLTGNASTPTLGALFCRCAASCECIIYRNSMYRNYQYMYQSSICRNIVDIPYIEVRYIEVFLCDIQHCCRRLNPHVPRSVLSAYAGQPRCIWYRNSRLLIFDLSKLCMRYLTLPPPAFLAVSCRVSCRVLPCLAVCCRCRVV